MEKSRKNAEKMRLLFNQAAENGDTYRLIFGYTEDVSRFNYGFSPWKPDEDRESDRRLERGQPDHRSSSPQYRIFPAAVLRSFTAGQRSLRPTGISIRRMHSSFIRIRKGISASTPTTGCRMRSCTMYVEQAEELAAFTEFFMNRFAGVGWEKIICDCSVMQRSGQEDAWLGGYDIFLCVKKKPLTAPVFYSIICEVT